MLHILPSLPIILPLGMAALLAAIGSFFPRRVFDSLGILATLATLAASLFLIPASLHAPIVYWFGDWKPTPNHFPIGISFVIDPIAAGMAAFVSLLVLFSFVFSWRYFKSIKSLYHAMMLVFLAAMNGLCLTGDLFNLFVWFELMTAAAVALCGYKSEETGPLQGALNFAVSNTVGAFLSLTGVAFLYAFTGALNFAEIGHSLATHPPAPSFLAVAFLLVTTGFLVKAAAAPFHFWLADAHAVAPTPVCVLFSGIMVELGLYAVARIYFGIFAPALHLSPDHDPYRTLLLIVGVVTALIGAVECFGQHHLKRLLAFSTISHSGLILIGISLLHPRALDGALTYLLGHGLVKAALFICAGILLNRFESVDEFDLYGKGKSAKGTGLLMLLGALGLLSLPPFGTFFGHDLIDHAADDLGLGWTKWIFIFAAALTAAAVLRFAVRCFLGIGSRRRGGNTGAHEPHEERETDNPSSSTPATMWIPAAVALLLALALPFYPHLRDTIARFSETLIHSHVYAATVLTAVPTPIPAPPPESSPTYWPPFLSLALALLFAAATLFSDKLPAYNPTSTLIAKLWHPFHLLQSGRITDYITWLTLGLAIWSALLLLMLQFQ